MANPFSLLLSLQASTNYKEAFALFDKRGNGRVTLHSLGDLLRACGQNPTLAEIQDLEKSVGGDCESILVYLRSIWMGLFAMNSLLECEIRKAWKDGDGKGRYKRRGNDAMMSNEG